MLQQRFLAYAEALDEIEQLSGRERAVALDLARRRLRHVLEVERAVLAEWDLAA